MTHSIAGETFGVRAYGFTKVNSGYFMKNPVANLSTVEILGPVKVSSQKISYYGSDLFDTLNVTIIAYRTPT